MGLNMNNDIPDVIFIEFLKNDKVFDKLLKDSNINKDKIKNKKELFIAIDKIKVLKNLKKL